MTASDPTPTFYDISLERLARDGVVRATVGEIEILAAQTAQGVRVYSGICPHLGGPLLEATVQDGIVRCPWHHYRFDLATGRCATAPGGPWRAIVGGSKASSEPMPIALAPLSFEETGGTIRVQLGDRVSRDGEQEVEREIPGQESRA